MISSAARGLIVAAAVLAAGSACSRDSANRAAKPDAAQPRAASVDAAASPAHTSASTTPSAANAERTPLALTGTVETVDAAAGILAIKNDEVPGWGMPPMTMSYHVSNPQALASLRHGDRITATVYAGDFAKLYDVRAGAKRAATAETGAKSSALPPLSYVCPIPGEENEIDDKPGTCAKSPTKLTPIRLVIAYECLKGPTYMQADPGVCRYDKSELAPITASMFWSCGDNPEGTRYLEPGTCADGSARQQRFEKRPHGDHNPRHGGPYVAMSEDLLHHAEGTFVAPGIFRTYFYDEYTRPMRTAGYVAQLVPTDSNAKEVGQSMAMTTVARLGSNVMEVGVANVPEPTSAAPLHFKLHVTVAPGAKDWTSDWDFTHYSKEPGITPPAAKTTSAGASSESAAVLANGGLVGTQASVGPVAPAPVPPTAAGILAELKTHTDSVTRLLNEGNLAGLWLDALRSKDLAIALEQQHGDEVPEAARPQLASAVQEITRSAWEIDAAGDLGQRDNIVGLQQVFSAAAANIQALYGSTHR